MASTSLHSKNLWFVLQLRKTVLEATCTPGGYVVFWWLMVIGSMTRNMKHMKCYSNPHNYDDDCVCILAIKASDTTTSQMSSINITP